MAILLVVENFEIMPNVFALLKKISFYKYTSLIPFS